MVTSSKNSVRPASIRTRGEPLGARCMLGFIVKVGAAIYSAISKDRSHCRSRPNAANKSMDVVSEEVCLLSVEGAPEGYAAVSTAVVAVGDAA